MIVSLLAAAAAAATPAEAPQVRFCPAAPWTYPLDDQRGTRSLLLQSVAVVNRAGPTLKVTSVDIDLMNAGEARDTRRYTGADLAALGRAAPMVEGYRAMIPGQFCSGAELGTATAATTPDVAAGQAFVILHQVFAWSGPRDAARVTFRGERGGRPWSGSATIPLRGGASRTQFHFPLKGDWYVGAGASLHSHHRWGVFEEFALDLVQAGSGGSTHTGDGTRFADYRAYGAPILAAADGKVVAVHDGETEDPAGMKVPGESDESYMTRLRKIQAERVAHGPNAIIGNYVVIDHGDGEFSQYAHLKPGSVKVAAGQVVKTGDQIGLLGSTGNSTEPHLHFQVCDAADPLHCAAIPITFIDIPDMAGHMLQTGDLVVVK
jgi:murein DD-endopeptidase MepM/ murein hydrolase activator NlpD